MKNFRNKNKEDTKTIPNSQNKIKIQQHPIILT